MIKFYEDTNDYWYVANLVYYRMSVLEEVSMPERFGRDVVGSVVSKCRKREYDKKKFKVKYKDGKCYIWRTE